MTQQTEQVRAARRGQVKTGKAIVERKQERPRKSQKHLKASEPVMFNDWAENEFVLLVYELLGENAAAKISKGTVIQEAAYELEISVETVKRYITKHTARRAEFREFQGFLFLNPRHKPRTAEDEL